MTSPLCKPRNRKGRGNYRTIPAIIDKLAAKYKYNPLPDDIKHKYRELWQLSMPYELSLTGATTGIQSINGRPIATGYARIVIGDYGAYIEIPPKLIIMDNIKVKPGQDKRITDPAYKYCKYHWYCPVDDESCKLYHQQRPVSYADYKPGMWYVSPFDVRIPPATQKPSTGRF